MNENIVILAGRLTRDPQLKYLPSQTSVCEFGVVSNRKYRSSDGKDIDKPTFVDVTAYGKQGELINQYFKKGKEIYIRGRLEYSSWEDKATQQKRSKLSVIVEKIEFVGAATHVDRSTSQVPTKDADSGQFQDADIPFG